MVQKLWINIYESQKWVFNNSDHYLCGGDEQNVCKGDSGGPLVASVNGKFTLMGITSFGPREIGCGKVSSVFTDVSHPSILRFIQSFQKK